VGCFLLGLFCFAAVADPLLRTNESQLWVVRATSFGFLSGGSLLLSKAYRIRPRNSFHSSDCSAFGEYVRKYAAVVVIAFFAFMVALAS
jgi:hypothetical protein